VPAHGRGLTADVLGQHPDDLAEGRADGIISVGRRVAAVKHRHDQAKGFGRGEHERRQPDPPAEAVAAVGPADGLHRDAGLAQDRDVAARRPLGHVQLRRQLITGDAGLGLQQFQDAKRPAGGTQVSFHASRLIRNPIVRNDLYGRAVRIRSRRQVRPDRTAEGELRWTSC
jgi:hypothetical protein